MLVQKAQSETEEMNDIASRVARVCVCMCDLLGSCAQVEPLRGVVPAHGHVTVSITFEPLALSTQVMELEVR